MGADVETAPSPTSSDAAAVHEPQPVQRAANITHHISTEKGDFSLNLNLEHSVHQVSGQLKIQIVCTSLKIVFSAHIMNVYTLLYC